MTCGTLVATAVVLVGVPVAAAAQVFVLAPAPASESSYRRTVVAWLPMPGAGAYHLQIDDDPAFGSPEVDVVDRPAYVLSGERLRLTASCRGARTSASTAAGGACRRSRPATSPACHGPRLRWITTAASTMPI